MIECSLGEIAEIVGGKLSRESDPDAKVTGGVEFDSRKVSAGDLFLALKGAIHDKVMSNLEEIKACLLCQIRLFHRRRNGDGDLFDALWQGLHDFDGSFNGYISFAFRAEEHHACRIYMVSCRK